MARTGTSTPKWNAAIINVIRYDCGYPAVTCQDVHPERLYCLVTVAFTA